MAFATHASGANVSNFEMDSWIMGEKEQVTNHIRRILDEFGPEVEYCEIQRLLAERFNLKSVPIATIFNSRWQILRSGTATPVASR